MLERWTRAVLRYRLVTLAAWLAVLGFGIAAATGLPSLLADTFAVPGSDSARAQAVLQRSFGVRDDGAFTVVFPVAHPTDKQLQAALQLRLDRAARAVPTAQARRLESGDHVLYAAIDTTLPLQQAKQWTPALRRALQPLPGAADPASDAAAPAVVTGQPAIQHDLDPVLRHDLRRGEVIALPVSALVLLAVLGLSLAAAAPLLLAAATIGGTLALVWALAHALPMVTYVSNVVELLGIGLAVDYALLVVLRFREELAAEASAPAPAAAPAGAPAPGRAALDDAIVRTMATAGRAAAFSGLTVAAGLGLLLAVDVPFVRSLGLAGLLVPLLAVAATLTLLPALLVTLGARAVRRAPVGAAAARRLGPLRRLGLTRRPRPGGERGWSRLANTVMRRPVLFLVLGAAALGAAAAPAAFLELTPASLAGLPSHPEALRGYRLLTERVGQGAVTPLRIVVDGGAPGAVRTPQLRAAIDRLGDRLFADREAYVIATGPDARYVDPTGRYRELLVVARHPYDDPATRALVARTRARHVPAAQLPAGTRVLVGGAPAQGVDFLHGVTGALPWLVVAVLGLAFLLLVRTFRSLLLPLKAVLLNLASTAAAYGLLVVVFRWGVGANTLGLYHLQAVESWLPIVLFATLFGVSMDYEVFMVTRMREAWDAGLGNRAAVAQGLERTGRVVTAAALIMAAAFSGFLAGSVAGLQELGAGLALAVLLDATVVRLLLVPALMALFDRWNWWLPQRREAP